MCALQTNPFTIFAPAKTSLFYSAYCVACCIDVCTKLERNLVIKFFAYICIRRILDYAKNVDYGITGETVISCCFLRSTRCAGRMTVNNMSMGNLICRICTRHGIIATCPNKQIHDGQLDYNIMQTAVPALRGRAYCSGGKLPCHHICKQTHYHTCNTVPRGKCIK